MGKPKPSRQKGQVPADRSLVDFDHPPVNEVVCGVGFHMLQNLSPAYIGLWWSENRAEFPKVRTVEPIMGHAEENKFPMSGRTMLVSDDETQIIQLQQTRFYYNWLKAREEQIYPRYSKVYKAFTNRFSKLSDFIAKNNIGELVPIEYALTYINHIEQGESWQSFADIHKVLPDISWRKSRRRKYLSEPSDVNFRYVFPIHDQAGRLTVTVQRGIRKSDQVPILRLELAAQASAADGLPKHSQKSMSEWFNAARKAIVLGFLDLTNEDVQIKVWGRRD